MKQVSIYKDGKLAFGAEFNTDEEVQEYLTREEAVGSFQINDKLIPAVTDFDGNEIIPATVVPKTHDFVITDVTAELAIEAEKQAKIAAGKAAREACQNVLDFIAGENLDKQLTIEQITEMQTIFAQAEASLRAGRPTYAKYFINSIEADGVLVTEEAKATCLQLLANY